MTRPRITLSFRRPVARSFVPAAVAGAIVGAAGLIGPDAVANTLGVIGGAAEGARQVARYIRRRNGQTALPVPAIIGLNEPTATGRFLIDWRGEIIPADDLPAMLGNPSGSSAELSRYAVKNGMAWVSGAVVRFRADADWQTLEALARHLAEHPDQLVTLGAYISPGWLALPAMPAIQAVQAIGSCRLLGRSGLPTWRAEQVAAEDAPATVRRALARWQDVGGTLTPAVFDGAESIPLDRTLGFRRQCGSLIYTHVPRQSVALLGREWAEAVLGSADNGAPDPEFTDCAMRAYHEVADGSPPLVERVVGLVRHPAGGTDPIWLPYWRASLGWSTGSHGRAVTGTCVLDHRIALHHSA